MRPIVPLTTILALTVACAPVADDELIFLDGRAVAPAGDSVLAMTGSQIPGVLLYHRHTDAADTLGAAELESPTHVQWTGDRWYVSDSRDGLAWIIVFGPDGRVERRFDVDSITGVLHQFAVLPDGSIVLETRDDRLISLKDDSVRTFALIEESPRTGLLAGARGGVLHLVPHKAITLYNERGQIRWRVDWEWDETVFVIDISIDSRGRPNVLAGREGHDEFMVFGFAPETGEVVRWREGPRSTFSVDHWGDIEPDELSHWLEAVSGA
jgi:hypothetical protein